MSQVLEDPHLQITNMMQPVQHAEIGDVRILRLPIRMGKSPAEIRSGAPLLGQHTAEILNRFGFTQKEMDEYLSQGIIE